MKRVLYLPEDSTFLARRWLETRSGCEPVDLLFRAKNRETAEKFRADFSRVADLRELPEPPTGEETHPYLRSEKDAAEHASAKVIVPIQPKPFLLRYYKPHMLPDLVPFYPLFRWFWSLGYSRYELFNLGGSLTFSIPHLLDEFTGRHKGERCFVVGNGPSLNAVDMTCLKDEITLGANRCYLGYERWGFEFTYWGITDWLQIEEYAGEYEQNLPEGTTKFFPFDYLPFLRFENACPVPNTFRNMEYPKFSDTCDCVHLGSTVTYFLIQIAAIMGCDPIILVGVDHRYDLAPERGPGRFVDAVRGKTRRWLERRLEGTAVHDLVRAYYRVRAENRPGKLAPGPKESVFWKAADASRPTHFDSMYVEGEQKRFRRPMPKWAERQFALAREWAEKKGVRILNATPGTALHVFPKISFEDLFR